MNRKTYRICLIVLIAVATISGLWYFQMTQKNHTASTEGTFVFDSQQKTAEEDEALFCLQASL